jgi:hypothetical protein
VFGGFSAVDDDADPPQVGPDASGDRTAIFNAPAGWRAAPRRPRSASDEGGHHPRKPLPPNRSDHDASRARFIVTVAERRI